MPTAQLPPRVLGLVADVSSSSLRRASCSFVSATCRAHHLQHQLRLQPQPLHGAFGDFERLGDLLLGVAAEVTHLTLGGAKILGRHRREAPSGFRGGLRPG